jgi:hypothetical protein
MKRTVAALLLILVAFFAADSLRALVQSAISAEVVRGLEAGVSKPPFTPSHSPFVHIAAFFGIYLVVGAAVAWILRGRAEAPVVALAVGLASPLSTLPFGPPAPFTWSTHAPVWLEMLHWANWYMPPLAALAGWLLLMFP